MPVRKMRKPSVANEKDLRAELVAELRNPKESGEPDIIIDTPHRSTIHLYVIWEKWKNLEQTVRSRIIFDAFAEVKGEKKADDVTIAMGLTREEADRLGIK